jgi:hypothetical protein
MFIICLKIGKTPDLFLFVDYSEIMLLPTDFPDWGVL